MIGVGFVIAATGDDWIGGRNYISNLLNTVEGLPGRRIETVLFAPADSSCELLDIFPVDRLVRTDFFKPKSVWRAAARVSRKLIGRSLLDEQMFRRHGVAVGALMAPLGAHSRFPTASWIPDFQHIHLPEFFRPDELAERDRVFGEFANDAELIIVSSNTALADLKRFSPGAEAKGRVLRFVVNPPQIATPGKAEIAALYQVDEPFLYLPNQFWAHKNHRVVIDALAILKARGNAPLVVCTGSTNDYRRPDHFASIMHHAAELGVADRFRVLGVVPYAHVLALFEQCYAIVNPSLFEGWSTSVEEAKSRGKRVIYSAIPTHIEQDPPRGLSFAPNDAEALADRIDEVMKSYDPAAEADAAAAAEEALPGRVREFALAFQSIVMEAAGLGE